MLTRPDTHDHGIAPGLARLEGRVHELRRTDSPPTLVLEVSLVREAGRSTPILSEGKLLRITIPSFLADTVKSINADKNIVCLIKYQQVSIADSNYPEWNLREIAPLQSES